MKKVFLALPFLFFSLVSRAQTPIAPPDWSTPSKVAPLYFGPNAFPVPETPDGRVKKDIYIELAADAYWGKLGGKDNTEDVFVRLSVPLWSRRVSLELWAPLVEHWNFSRETALFRRLPDALEKQQWKGFDMGDIYLATNLQALVGRPNSFRPDILVRAVLKTASGNTFGQARYYDAAGYFFDATFAWSRVWEGSFVRELRAALNGGFLCWQTGTGKQNDAFQYGLTALLDTRAFSFTADWGGYVGWEKDGDAPRRVRLRLDGHIGRWQPFVQYTLGTHHYPFQGVRLGIACRFGIGL